jgi:xylulokinase
MHLIGLDIGTTGCKAVVFDEGGKILGSSFREYGVDCSEPAMAEQDAESVWAAAQEALQAAVAQSGRTDRAALSLSVQGDAIIPIDREGRALYPAILGMDYRSQPQAGACDREFGSFELFQATGMRPHPMNSLVKVLWLREQRPEVFDRAWRIVTYADFVLGKLGAEPVIDHTMASRTMAFDLLKQEWSASILGRLGLSGSLFSPAIPSGKVVGQLRPDLAETLGLPPSTMLVTGGHDQTCAALGAGMVQPGMALVSTGTAEVAATAFAKPALTRSLYEGYYPCYLHAKAGLYFTFSLNHTGGILLKWYRDQFCTAEIAEAGTGQFSAYALLDARMPEGPSPVMVLPHHNGSGTPWCDLASKGAIVGLTLGTTRHDVAKAIREALAFELLVNLEAMQTAGIQVQALTAVGGGARSTVWLQLKADILDRPIRTLKCPEAACLGAAMLAGTAAGVYASLDAAATRLVAPDREYEPHPERAAWYRERFALYRQLYPALRSLHHQL